MITPKHRIVVQRCPFPRALAVYISDPTLLNWAGKIMMRVEESPGLSRACGSPGLGSNTVVVSPCYDVGEVMAEFENPPDIVSVVKLGRRSE